MLPRVASADKDRGGGCRANTDRQYRHPPLPPPQILSPRQMRYSQTNPQEGGSYRPTSAPGSERVNYRDEATGQRPPSRTKYRSPRIYVIYLRLAAVISAALRRYRGWSAAALIYICMSGRPITDLHLNKNPQRRHPNEHTYTHALNIYKINIINKFRFKFDRSIMVELIPLADCLQFFSTNKQRRIHDMPLFFPQAAGSFVILSRIGY